MKSPGKHVMQGHDTKAYSFLKMFNLSSHPDKEMSHTLQPGWG